MAPNINFENPDEDSEKLKILSEKREEKFDVYLSNSLRLGGTNSSLVLKAWKE
jgi:3-oxoacyl-[acyl-carrier-protein] synthase I (EC 2.3.1.41)